MRTMNFTGDQGFKRYSIRKSLLATLAICGWILSTTVANGQSKQQEKNGGNSQPQNKGFAVIELFTSEGCSSCPPADDVLERIDHDYPGQVLTLGFHVDYWDHLGWKDPFSSPAYSDRQRAYANTSWADGVYTPQAIVNGGSAVVGSREQILRQLIDQKIKNNINREINIHAGLVPGSHKIAVSYKAAFKPGDELLNIVLVQRSASDKISAGENSGRLLKHINIVRDLKVVSSNEGSLQFILPEQLKASDFQIAAFIQEKQSLRINASTVLISIQ